MKLERMERRLDRQVLVDQNIEKELQEKIAQLESRNRELKQQCSLMDQEYDLIEQENLRLRRDAKRAQGASERLEKIVYGKIP